MMKYTPDVRSAMAPITSAPTEATAIAAGIIAFLLRRSREEEEPANRMAKLARNWAGSDSVEAGRDFVMDKIVPELRPALLSGLSEIEDIVDQAFRRIEKNIKKL